MDGIDYAKGLDAKDGLAKYRDEFYLLKDTIYMDGNSLGLLSKRAERTVHRVTRFMEIAWY